MIAVTYLPDNPALFREGSVSRDTVEDRKALWIDWICFGLLLTVGGWLLVEHHYRSTLRLLREGQVIRGIVTQIQSETTAGITMNYVVELPSGHLQRKSLTASKEFAAAHPVGTAFTVLSDTIAPDSNRPYFHITEAEIEGAAPHKT